MFFSLIFDHHVIFKWFTQNRSNIMSFGAVVTNITYHISSKNPVFTHCFVSLWIAWKSLIVRNYSKESFETCEASPGLTHYWSFIVCKILNPRVLFMNKSKVRWKTIFSDIKNDIAKSVSSVRIYSTQDLANSNILSLLIPFNILS